MHLRKLTVATAIVLIGLAGTSCKNNSTPPSSATTEDSAKVVNSPAGTNSADTVMRDSVATTVDSTDGTDVKKKP